MNGVERQYQPGNVFDALEKQRQELEMARRAEVRADEVSEVSDDLGEMRSGRFLALTSGSDPTDGDANGVFMSSSPIEFPEGTVNVGGVKDGRLQFGISALDGSAMFAGGKGTLNYDGLNLNGIRYGMKMRATSNMKERIGSIEMGTKENGNPILQINYYGAPSGELVVNGDAETGDTSGWSAGANTQVTSDPNEIISGNYSFKLLLTNNSYASLETPSNARIQVSDTKKYLLRFKAIGRLDSDDQDAGDGRILRVFLIWRDSLGNGVSGGPEYRAIDYTFYEPLDLSEYEILVFPPLSATQLSMSFLYGSALGIQPGYMILDDISLQEVETGTRLTIDDDGFHVATGQWKKQGPTQNRGTSSSFSVQIARIHVRQTIKLHAVEVDIRNLSTYTLSYLRGPNITQKWADLAPGALLGAGSKSVITLSKPLILTPGIHYLALSASSATTWWDYNAATYQVDDLFFDGVYYNTTLNSFSPPWRLVYTPVLWG